MKKQLMLALFIVVFMIAGFGCAKKQVQTEPEKVEPQETEVTQQEPVKKEAPKKVKPKKVPPTPMELYELDYADLTLQHTVEKGECLWWIAEYKKIYNDPFMWPLIYKANRNQINDPDLIYPGQVFYIPRTFELDELRESRRSAGAPKPYLPPRDANVPAELRVELGWGF